MHRGLPADGLERGTGSGRSLRARETLTNILIGVPRKIGDTISPATYLPLHLDNTPHIPPISTIPVGPKVEAGEGTLVHPTFARASKPGVRKIEGAGPGGGFLTSFAGPKRAVVVRKPAGGALALARQDTFTVEDDGLEAITI